MIKVTIELESAITGETTKLGEMRIANDGTSRRRDRGNYTVGVSRKGDYDLPFARMSGEPLRKGYVSDYPRLSYNIWRLVLRALKSAFPEEK